VRITRASDQEEASLGLAPLIDVVLLLLIFFLVTSSFAQPRIPLDLPRAESGEAPVPRSLTVTLTAEGGLHIDERSASLDALAALLEERAEGETDLLVRADEEVGHGRVVEVLDLARRHAVEKLGIAVAAGGSGSGAGRREAPSAAGAGSR